MPSAISPLQRRSGNTPGASWTAGSQLSTTPLKLGTVDQAPKKFELLDELDEMSTIAKLRGNNTKETGEFLA